MNRDIARIIKQAHVEVKNRLTVMRAMISGLASMSDWEKRNDMCAYFIDDLDAHFRNEELMMGIIKRDNKLEEKHLSYIDSVIREHKELRELFSGLKRKLQLISADNREEREAFAAKTDEIVDRLLAHAEKEDAVLIPLAEELLTDETLRELERQISERGSGARR
jgi:hemerythrin-like domain-containing protein